MLIAIEKDIALKIKSNKDKIIDKIAESSAEMSTMLLLHFVNDWNEHIVHMNTSNAGCLETCPTAERRPTVYSWIGAWYTRTSNANRWAPGRMFSSIKYEHFVQVSSNQKHMFMMFADVRCGQESSSKQQ